MNPMQSPNVGPGGKDFGKRDDPPRRAREPKLDFDEALQRLNEERGLNRSEVQARALKRKVWVAEWHVPGCIPESASYSETKAAAVEDALGFAGDEAPRGMKTALEKYGRFDHRTDLYGDVITTVEQHTLGDLL